LAAWQRGDGFEYNLMFGILPAVRAELQKDGGTRGWIVYGRGRVAAESAEDVGLELGDVVRIGFGWHWGRGIKADGLIVVGWGEESSGKRGRGDAAVRNTTIYFIIARRRSRPAASGAKARFLCGSAAGLQPRPSGSRHLCQKQIPPAKGACGMTIRLLRTADGVTREDCGREPWEGTAGSTEGRSLDLADLCCAGNYRADEVDAVDRNCYAEDRGDFTGDLRAAQGTGASTDQDGRATLALCGK
jgi:hypothetical protein